MKISVDYTVSLRLFSFISDHGEEVYIPSPERDYPPAHYLDLAHAYA
ncbi:MAG: hypothetical protein LHW52_01210 [Candidatus Cloacimonetes bacterium]|nr:hypothetical protein [Candidatus Cloacimonadota bacterium]